MNLGFEVTTDDIITVAKQFGRNISLDEANILFDKIDIDSVLNEALKENNKIKQQQSAYQNIKAQLEAIGYFK